MALNKPDNPFPCKKLEGINPYSRIELSKLGREIKNIRVFKLTRNKVAQGFFPGTFDWSYKGNIANYQQELRNVQHLISTVSKKGVIISFTEKKKSSG